MAEPHQVLDIHETQCCVVGGGPAGIMLGYLLARQGVAVTVLEAHNDFDREFRGDTVHPSTLEVLDSLGLADRVLQIPHANLDALVFETPQGSIKMADFDSLKSQTKFPYIALIPQVKFLDLMAAEARKLPSFSLRMGANVKELVEEQGVVRGVRYQSHEGWHEVRAAVTVAADGRFSKVRALTGLEPVKSSPPMDVLWFKLPRPGTDPAEEAGHFFIGHGRMVIQLNRGDYWQMGYVIPKGGYQELKAAGLEALRTALAESVPNLREVVASLQSWTQVAPLLVESSRLTRWHRPGLLLIGDAAHVMSPVGGVGINYAIQDAVVASNVLGPALKAGRVDERVLTEVQRQREWPTRLIQSIQATIQRQLVGAALDARRPFRPPWIMRLPVMRSLFIKLVAFGPRRVRVTA